MTAFAIGMLAVSLFPGAPATAHLGFSFRPASTANCYGKTSGGTNACFYIETVDYNSADNNYITGIDNEYNIVGAYTDSNNFNNGLVAYPSPSPTGYPSFTLEDYSEDYSTDSTFLAGIDNGSPTGAYMVGYAITRSCTSGSCTTVGVVLHNGSWSTIQDPSAPTTGKCAVTEVLAMNDSQIGVGFYDTGRTTSGACQSRAFEFYCPAATECTSSNQYTYFDIGPPQQSNSYTSSTANGINNLGDVVGTATLSSGHSEGWYYSELQYFWLTNNASSGITDSAALGVNFSDPPAVVGYYVDGKGTHGFLVKQVEQTHTTYDTTIDYLQHSPPYTVVNSINKYWAISGWSEGKGPDGTMHGFVGLCSPDKNCKGSGLRTRGGRLGDRRPSVRHRAPRNKADSDSSFASGTTE